MTTPIPDSLCQSLNVRKEQPIVLQKELVPGYLISLRPVSMHDNNDINVIQEWLTDGYPGKAGLPADQLRVFFILLAESTYAQAFMVLLNGITPIGQLEVYQVLHDELKDAVDAREGDFRIYVPVMPVISDFPQITIQILQTCLSYFFSCIEVKRIFWVIPVSDAARNKVALNTGFGLHKSLRELTIDGEQPAKVYQYTRLM
ncbi:hypothetical protein A3860_30575 [Niastella vici]|uniref:N-acetyltransferase domain-containing protein n=1 Tax=Niastella vici TaxID=1703345 RepID=A0A1V9FTY6_9BACT|nr:GNAT family N-acetyltransferase [Niastella vici]OQP61814.1 hypothetical protein A3860_30575 [Niastella vici]